MTARRLAAALVRRMTGTIIGVQTECNAVALTFDDGPDAQFTPRLLDILADHTAHATFFMLGCLAARHPELVATVSARGHAIGNHSWNHLSFPLLRPRQRREQRRRCANALSPYGRRLFRPPFGHQTTRIQIETAIAGYRTIAWNLLVDDWREKAAAELYDDLVQKLIPGSIILLHDGLFDAETEAARNRMRTLEAVDMLLSRLSGAYRFVTVPELLTRGAPVRRNFRKLPDPEWLQSLKRPAYDS